MRQLLLLVVVMALGCAPTPQCEKTGRRAYGKVHGYAQVAYQYKCPDRAVYWRK
jgi:hypothetical protein